MTKKLIALSPSLYENSSSFSNLVLKKLSISEIILVDELSIA